MNTRAETLLSDRLPDPLNVIRRAHRQARLNLLVWSLGLALLGEAAMRAAALGWWTFGETGWIAAGASSVLLLIWVVRLSRTTLPRTARKLDSEWRLCARVESAWEMAESDSEIARAQRADLARRISGRALPLTVWWRSGLVMLAVAAAVHIAQFAEPVRARLASRGASVRAAGGQAAGVEPQGTSGQSDESDSRADATAVIAANPVARERKSPTAVTPPPRKPDTHASLTWMTPSGEIKATQIESVPLTARVITRTGLHHATLEVSVNGKPRASVPVPPDIANQICVATDATIRLELHLDELNVKELDYVTYHLRAERNAPESVPPARSGIQFIEIKPLNKKKQGPPPEARDRRFVQMFFGVLKVHVGVMKNTFAAVNDPTPTAAQTRAPQLRVAEQGALDLGERLYQMIIMSSGSNPSSKAQNAEGPPPRPKPYVPFSLESGLPRALEALEKAVATLGTGDLARAYEDEQAALIALIACKEDMGESEPPFMPERKSMTDPFEDHANNPGQQEEPGEGTLRALATREGAITQALGDMIQKQGDLGNLNEDLSNVTEAQGKLAHDIQQLSPGQSPGDDQLNDMENAGKSATEAAEHLAKGDLSRALARASQASRSLQEALRKQELAARADAQAQLEAARRDLQRAKQAADNERNSLLNATAGDLRSAADSQTQNGSQKAAMALAEVADAIEKLAGTAGGTEERWSVVQQKAAAAQVSLGSSAAAGERVARQLRRTREGLEASGPSARKEPDKDGKADPGGTAEPNAGMTELKLAAQLAASLLASSSSDLRDTRALESETDAMVSGKGSRARLIQAIERVERALAHRVTAGRRDETIRKFDPDDVDPEYRAATEAYFEKLSGGVKP